MLHLQDQSPLGVLIVRGVKAIQRQLAEPFHLGRLLAQQLHPSGGAVVARARQQVRLSSPGRQFVVAAHLGLVQGCSTAVTLAALLQHQLGQLGAFRLGQRPQGRRRLWWRYGRGDFGSTDRSSFAFGSL